MQARPGVREALGDRFMFLRRFLRDPRSVGAIAPSSRFLASRMLDGIDIAEGSRVVEFGPGTGSFTSAIARVLPGRIRYLGIERDPVFVETLRRRWPELEFACDSVVNLIPLAGERGVLPVDHIISGLPFASLPRSVTVPVLDAAHGSLRAGGTFTTFQYVHAYGLPSARAFRREMERRFGRPASRRMVLRNVPPAFVLGWRKDS